MSCDEARIQLLDYHRGRLAPGAQRDLCAHLEACVDCARADVVERELTSILEERLPQHPGSVALKRRLAAEWPAPSVERAWWSRWRRALVPALAVAAAALVAVPVVYYERASSRMASERAGMVTEAVNDHLRLLVSQHPLEIESSAFHRVKPWFEGRLDFAPAVTFEGNDDFPLKGGAVGYFKDRRAAATRSCPTSTREICVGWRRRSRPALVDRLREEPTRRWPRATPSRRRFTAVILRDRRERDQDAQVTAASATGSGPRMAWKDLVVLGTFNALAFELITMRHPCPFRIRSGNLSVVARTGTQQRVAKCDDAVHRRSAGRWTLRGAGSVPNGHDDFLFSQRRGVPSNRVTPQMVMYGHVESA
jgi:anti-sigma factor RsiW